MSTRDVIGVVRNYRGRRKGSLGKKLTEAQRNHYDYAVARSEKLRMDMLGATPGRLNYYLGVRYDQLDG